MSNKKSWSQLVAVILVWFVVFLSGITMLHSLNSQQETTQESTQAEDTTQKKKKDVDSPGKTSNKGKVQTPAQTAAIRKALEAKDKARAEAKAKAEAELAAKAAADAAANAENNAENNADGEDLNENGDQVKTAIIAPVKTTKVITDLKKTKTYWQGLKLELDKKIEEVKAILVMKKEKLGQTRMNFLSEPSPLRQREMQEEINKLISDINVYESVLANTVQEQSELSDKARKAGVPPGWIR